MRAAGWPTAENRLVGRPALLLLLLPLFVLACASRLPSLADEQSRNQPIVRLLTDQGGDQTLVTNGPGSSQAPGKLTPPPTSTVTPTGTVTPTATITPTVTRTPRATATVTATPTATATPRGGPDLVRMVGQFARVQRYRATLTGPANLTQEVVPERMRVLVSAPQQLELIVQDQDVFLRRGSFWQRLDDPPADYVARLDRGIPALQQMAALKHQYELQGTVRARAGRCLDWNVADARPKEPISICQGLADDLPYRIQLAGGATVEFYDFDQQITVLQPWPELGAGGALPKPAAP